MSYINAEFTGNLGSDPELSLTKSGIPVANFSVAVTPRIKQDDGSYKDGETQWVRVSAWRNLGEKAAAALKKGQRVTVKGVLSLNEYEAKDGEKRASLQVSANDITLALPNGNGASPEASAAEALGASKKDDTVF